MITIDFHTHTHHSYDSAMKPARIIEIAHQKGLSGIVINDHNTIKGGLEAQKLNPYPDFQVIVGAEIKTDAGDVTGILLKDEIVSRKFKDVAHEIKEQGGIVILNHPFVAHKLDLIDYALIDLVEGYNSRLSPRQNQLALELAAKIGKPIVAGSDAHIYSEIGNCYTSFNCSTLLNPHESVYKRTGYLSVAQSQLIKASKSRDIKLMLRLMLYTPKQVAKRMFFES